MDLSEFDPNEVSDYVAEHQDPVRVSKSSAVVGLLALAAERCRDGKVSKEEYLQAADAAWKMSEP